MDGLLLQSSDIQLTLGAHRRPSALDLMNSSAATTTAATIDLLEVYEALPAVIVIRKQPIGRAAARSIELGLRRFSGTGLLAAADEGGRRTRCRRCAACGLAHDFRLLQHRRIRR